MIEKFKKSRLGQTIICCFIVVSVAVAIMVWFYESIRIPALNERVSVRDDKIKELEAAIEKEKIFSSRIASALEQRTNENAALTVKLRQSQDDYARLVDRQVQNAISMSTNSSASKDTNGFNRLAGINWKQAVLATGDQEDISFFMVDRVVTELRFTAGKKYDDEMDALLAAIPKVSKLPQSDVYNFFKDLGERIGYYTKLRVNLEELRVQMTKYVLAHYREEMGKADGKPLEDYYSAIREKPTMLASLAELGKSLQNMDHSIGWTSNASYSIQAFIKSNQIVGATAEKGK